MSLEFFKHLGQKLLKPETIKQFLEFVEENVLSDARGTQPTPFNKYAVKVQPLITPAALATGSLAHATAFVFPGNIAPRNFLIHQETGAVTSGGTVAGLVEGSPDGGTTWVTLATFTTESATGGNQQIEVLNNIYPEIRYSYTIGGSSGSIVVSASVIY